MTRTADDKLKLLERAFNGMSPMSAEEAGEEILLGPFQKCVPCDGNGGWNIHDEYSTCDKCFGHGKAYRDKYMWACYVLDMPLPEMPKSQFQLNNEAVQGFLMYTSAQEQKRYQRLKEASMSPISLPSFFPPWAKQ